MAQHLLAELVATLVFAQLTLAPPFVSPWLFSSQSPSGLKIKMRLIVIKAELAYTYQYYKVTCILQRRIDQGRCSCQSKSSSVMRTKTNRF
ncbi:MAG TPA: hypothetical protein VFZ02_08770, partial [Ktedonobacteraceae bacterium]